jgi:hypothetical protein
MFLERDYYARLKIWNQLRSQLEESTDSFGDLQRFYRNAPLVSMAADPYDKQTWPDPWEQVEENIYCPFTVVLAMFYSLQLSRRFCDSRFEIHIGTDAKREQVIYCLIVDGNKIGLWDEEGVPDIISREVHIMS